MSSTTPAFAHKTLLASNTCKDPRALGWQHWAYNLALTVHVLVISALVHERLGALPTGQPPLVTSTLLPCDAAAVRAVAAAAMLLPLALSLTHRGMALRRTAAAAPPTQHGGGARTGSRRSRARSSLDGRLARGRGRATPVAPARTPRYASTLQRCIVSAKLLPPPGTDAATLDAAVACAMRDALAAVASRSGGALSPTAARPPALQAYVGFPGCYHGVGAGVGVPAALDAAAITEELQALLPAGTDLLAVDVTSDQHQVAAAAGAWAEPVALRAGERAQRVALTLPAGLLDALADAGRALRVVVSDTMRGAALMDATLRPGQPEWPEEGVLDLCFASEVEGPLVMVSLLSAPAAAGGGGGAAPHGADVFVTSLPLLVLEPHAHAEVLALWDDMTHCWLAERPPLAGAPAQAAMTVADVAAASAALFSSQFLPLAHDMSAAMLLGAAAVPVENVECLLTFFRQQGMSACAQLVLSAAEEAEEEVEALADAADAPTPQAPAGQPASARSRGAGSARCGSAGDTCGSADGAPAVFATPKNQRIPAAYAAAADRSRPSPPPTPAARAHPSHLHVSSRAAHGVARPLWRPLGQGSPPSPLGAAHALQLLLALLLLACGFVRSATTLFCLQLAHVAVVAPLTDAVSVWHRRRRGGGAGGGTARGRPL